MRRSRLFISLGALTALACVSAFWLAPAEGFGRRRSVCCYQPVYVPVEPCVPCCVAADGNTNKTDPNSTKVNLLLILDTDDRDIGKDVQSEGKALEVLLFSLRREQRGQIDFVEGKELTRDNVLKAVRDIQVGPKETLLVYCNLHGEKQAGTGEQLMEMRQDESGAPRETISRTDLMDEIKRKNARLTLLITDSCYQGSAVEEDFPTAAKVHRVAVETSVSNAANAVLTDLLVNHSGVVNINSCSPNECAFGQVFTPTFIDVTNDYDVLSGPVTWESFFGELKTKTNGRFTAAKDTALKDETEGKGAVPAEMRAQDSQIPITFQMEDGKPTWPKYEKVSDVEAPATGGAPAAPSAMPAPAEASADKPALIAVRVPESARLFIDDEPTRQTSDSRLFTTPGLAAGRDFCYTLRAEMTADGKTLVQSKEVHFRAGERVTVTFDDMRAVERPAAAADAVAARADEVEDFPVAGPAPAN